MKNKMRTTSEFDRELQHAVLAGELVPTDLGYAFRGAAASDLLVRLHEKGEDVRQVASAWNDVLRPFRVQYRVLGIPLFSIKSRPIVITDAHLHRRHRKQSEQEGDHDAFRPDFP